MKLKAIYDLFVEMGIENDPRGRKAIKKQLKKKMDEYKESKGPEREEFDKEGLKNPFSDTRILYGNENSEIKSILAGIDMEVGEVLLADRLREKGERIDLIVSHHPEAKALVGLSDVMSMQADIWEHHGVPINIGDALITDRMREVQRAFLPLNHTRHIDATKLLDIPFLCAHTVADNMVSTYVQRIMDDIKPDTLKEIIDKLKEVPEYKIASKTSIGPTIIVGSPKKRAGKVMVDMTGGTSGPKKVIEKLADAGVGTIVGMHMNEKSRDEAAKHHINVVIAGHIPSDAIGMNLLLDAIEKKGVNIIPCSGLIRVRR